MTIKAPLLATALVTALGGVAAHGAQVEYCVRAVSLTFDPPLGLGRTHGTVTRDQTAVCVRAGTSGALPHTVGFPGRSVGTYVGDCLHAEVAGEFSMTLVGGAAGVLYAASQNYAVADALVLVPNRVCDVATASGVETGPGIWP